MSIVYPVYTVHSIDHMYVHGVSCTQCIPCMLLALQQPLYAYSSWGVDPYSHILRSLTPGPAIDNGHLKNSEGSRDIAHLRSFALVQVIQVTNALLLCQESIVTVTLIHFSRTRPC